MERKTPSWDVQRHLTPETFDHYVAKVRAEPAREGEVLLRRQALVVEEQHQAIMKGALDLREGRVLERLGEVHAMDVGAKRARHRPDLDVGVGGCHGPTIGACAAATKDCRACAN